MPGVVQGFRPRKAEKCERAQSLPPGRRQTEGRYGWRVGRVRCGYATNGKRSCVWDVGEELNQFGRHPTSSCSKDLMRSRLCEGVPGKRILVCSEPLGDDRRRGVNPHVDAGNRAGKLVAGAYGCSGDLDRVADNLT